MNELRLKLIAKWLKEETVYVDSYEDGTLERAIKYAKEETYQRIGDLIEEIMEADEKQLQGYLEE